MGEWQETQLGKVCRFKSGDAFKKERQGQAFGAVPFVKVSDLNLGGNEISISRSNNWISEEDARSYTVHPVGAVLFAKIGIALTYNRRRRIIRPTVADNNLMSAIPMTVDSIWLYYLLCTLDFNEISSGSALPYLTVKDLNGIDIEVPPTWEQQAIAAVLSALDDKIELNRGMNETLEASARALFRDWFVDFGPTRAKVEGRPAYLAPDFWSLFPDRLGDDGVPEGWGWESLIDQAHWVNGAAYKNMDFVDRCEGLPVVKIAELKAGVTGQTKFTNTNLGTRYRINHGELLFSWSGNPDTSIDAFVWTGGAAWLNQHIFAVRENGKRAKAELFVLLKWLMPEFAEIARNKQTTGLGHVTKDDMKRLRVVVASQTVQEAFAKRIAPIFDQILSNIAESRTLAATRDALLPKLMSGELRVRNAEALAA